MQRTASWSFWTATKANNKSGHPSRAVPYESGPAPLPTGGLRTVTLTNDQWNTLYFYLLTSTKYRNSEIEAWERLALETNEDGSPKFIHAADNARYLRDQEKTLHEIAQSIC